MKTLMTLFLTLFLSTMSHAALTSGNIPDAKTGGSTPVLQNSPLSSDGTNVGVGSTTPGQKLDVNGTIRATNFSGPATGLTSLPAAQVSGVIPIANLATGTPNGSKFIRDDGTLVIPTPTSTPGGSSGQYNYNNAGVFAGGSMLTTNGTNVGVGTTVPDRKLDVVNSDTNTTLTTASLAGMGIKNLSNSVPNNFADMAFSTTDANGAIQLGSKISGIFTSHTAGAVSGGMAFLNKTAGTTAEAMRIIGSNVGIGVTSPTQSLDVNGTVKAVSFIGSGSGSSYVTGNMGIGTTSPKGMLDFQGKEYWLKTTDSIVTALSSAASGDKIHLAGNHTYTDTDCNMVIDAKSLYLDFNGAKIVCNSTGIAVLTISGIVSGTNFVYIDHPDITLNVTSGTNQQSEGIYVNQQGSCVANTNCAAPIIQWSDLTINHPRIIITQTSGTGQNYGILHEDASSLIISPKVFVGVQSGADIDVGAYGIAWREENTAQTGMTSYLENPDIYTLRSCTTSCATNGFNRGIDFYKRPGSPTQAVIHSLYVNQGYAQAQGGLGEGCKVTNDSGTPFDDTNLTIEYLNGTVCYGSQYDIRNASSFGAIGRFVVNGVIMAHGVYNAGTFASIQEVVGGSLWGGGVKLSNAPAVTDNSIGPGVAAPAVMSVVGITGGNQTQDGNNNSGGVGAGGSFTGGQGGEAPLTTGSHVNTGGAGGAWSFTGGQGGSPSSNSIDRGGAGGAINLTGGPGGNVGIGTNGNGGKGGDVVLDGGNIGIGTTNNGANGNILLNTNNTSANVGIGSATPGTTLDVNGTIRATAFSGGGIWVASGSNYYYSAGNVGIGTTVFPGVLTVNASDATMNINSSTTPGTPQLILKNTDTLVNDFTTIVSRTNASNATTTPINDAYIKFIHSKKTNGTQTGDLAIALNDQGTFKNALFLDGDLQRMGITEINNPAYTLSMDGVQGNRTIGVERNYNGSASGKNLTVTAGGAALQGVMSTINATPTAAGSGYVVGDVLTLTSGSGTGKVMVTSVDGSGAVLTLSLFKTNSGDLGIGQGSGYTATTGFATSGGTGSGCTVEITAVKSTSNNSGGNLILQGGVSTGTGTSDIIFQTSPGNVGISTVDNTITTAVTIKGSGNVGIGTDITPDATLEVTALTGIPALMVSSTATSNGDKLLVDSGGNVGIGTVLTGTNLITVGGACASHQGDGACFTANSVGTTCLGYCTGALGTCSACTCC